MMGQQITAQDFSTTELIEALNERGYSVDASPPARTMLDLIAKRVEEMREGEREVMKTRDERVDRLCASGAHEALTKLRLYLDELRGRSDV